VPRVARVEPITTARALRGPFDYLRPDGVDVGSLLVVPFGRRDVLGVVVGVADETEIAEERLVAPREVLDAGLPVDLVELAHWIADEYCSTPARGLSLVAPTQGTGARMAWWAEAVGGSDGLTPRQEALLEDLRATGPRVAGADLPALRRLERRGLIRLERRAVRRAPQHASVGARRPQPALTAEQAAALAEIEAAIAER
jgi:primosomal protein N' (replication factor Y) (superfamily II helicase)